MMFILHFLIPILMLTHYLYRHVMYRNLRYADGIWTAFYAQALAINTFVWSVNVI